MWNIRIRGRTFKTFQGFRGASSTHLPGGSAYIKFCPPHGSTRRGFLRQRCWILPPGAQYPALPRGGSQDYSRSDGFTAGGGLINTCYSLKLKVDVDKIFTCSKSEFFQKGLLAVWNNLYRGVKTVLEPLHKILEINHLL